MQNVDGMHIHSRLVLTHPGLISFFAKCDVDTLFKLTLNGIKPSEDNINVKLRNCWPIVLSRRKAVGL
jgi:hypothetical protein